MNKILLRALTHKRKILMASISVAVLLIFGFVASDQIFIVTIPMFKDNRTGLPYIKVDVCDKPMSALIGFRSLSNSLSMLSSNGIIETVRKDMGYIHYANDHARVSTGIHSSNETFIETDDIPKGFDGSLTLSFFFNIANNRLHSKEDIRITLDFRNNQAIIDSRPWRSHLHTLPTDIALSLSYSTAGSNYMPLIKLLPTNDGSTNVMFGTDLACGLILTKELAMLQGNVVEKSLPEASFSGGTMSHPLTINTQLGRAKFLGGIASNSGSHSVLGFNELNNKVVIMDFRDKLVIIR